MVIKRSPSNVKAKVSNIPLWESRNIFFLKIWSEKDEKVANKYEFDFEDDDDDYILITLDGIYKQIYVGRDMPICFEKSKSSMQPLVSEVVEDMQYFLEGWKLLIHCKILIIKVQNTSTKDYYLLNLHEDKIGNLVNDLLF